jgi:hypothetical protein
MINTYGQTPKQLFRNPHLQGTYVRGNMLKVIHQLVQQSYSVSVDADFDHGHTYVVSCFILKMKWMKKGGLWIQDNLIVAKNYFLYNNIEHRVLSGNLYYITTSRIESH